MSFIGVRIEISNRVPKIKNIIDAFDAVNTTKVKVCDLNLNGRVLVNKQNNLITVNGKQEDKIYTGMANFSMLMPVKTENKELERITKIINVLGNDRLIKEKVKMFVMKQSVLNKMLEFSELGAAFESLNKIIPGFIEIAWYYAPEIKTE